jgi:hypothetical protein
MAVLGGFKVPDILHFCQHFKKLTGTKKANLASKVLVSSPI